MTNHDETVELLAEARRLMAENLVESLRREREMRWFPSSVAVLVLISALTSVANLIVVLLVKCG